MGKLPDFVVIGAMKAGTTSLHEWLRVQPEVWMHPDKEPHFFSHDWMWDEGVERYAAGFGAVPDGVLAGEASTSYSDPAHLPKAAERMRSVVPEVQIVYVVRHPIERMRSDFAHQVREGRQRAPFVDAVSAHDSGHLARSRYFSCLEPYIDRFDRARLCVVRFEDLVGGSGRAWTDVLAHLGLPPRPSPGGSHNRAEDRPNAPGLKRILNRFGVIERLPGPARRVGAAALSGRGGGRLLASAADPVPDDVAALIWNDVDRLEAWLGTESPLWER